jgi:hypothetical protein
VAEYQLKKVLPKQLKGELPSMEELEAEIEKEIEEHKKPADKKLDRIKSLIEQLNHPAVQEKRNAQNTKKILTQLIFPFRDGLRKALTEIVSSFEETEIILWTGSQGHFTDKAISQWLKEHEETNDLRIEIALKGFKPAGTKAFDVRKEIIVVTEKYHYYIRLGRHITQPILFEKLYHQDFKKEELEMLINKAAEAFYDEIEERLKQLNSN